MALTTEEKKTVGCWNIQSRKKNFMKFPYDKYANP